MGADQGEHDAFTRTYSSTYHLVLRYCYRRVGDMEAARELTQEAFVVAWRRRHDEPQPSLPWLYGIARRVLADHRRAKQVRIDTVPMVDSHLAAEDGEFDAIGLAHDVRRALAKLPELDREVLRLVSWEDLDLGSTAQVLGCSRSAAAVRLFRARQRLARLVNGSSSPPARKALAFVRGGGVG